MLENLDDLRVARDALRLHHRSGDEPAHLVVKDLAEVLQVLFVVGRIALLRIFPRHREELAVALVREHRWNFVELEYFEQVLGLLVDLGSVLGRVDVFVSSLPVEMALEVDDVADEAKNLFVGFLCFQQTLFNLILCH